MTHTNLVANELSQAGFQTSIFNSNIIVVSLKNRKPASMEVVEVLQERLQGIHFTVNSTTNNVLVTF